MILLKLVILALPVYILAGSKVPKAVIDKVEKLMRNFLWDNENDNHPINWKIISKSKEEGGLALFSLRDISKALM